MNMSSSSDYSEYLSEPNSNGYAEERIRGIPITPDPEMKNGRLSISSAPGEVINRTKYFRGRNTAFQRTWLPNGDLDTNNDAYDDPFSSYTIGKAISATSEPAAIKMKYNSLRRVQNGNTQIMPSMVLPGSEHVSKQAMLPRYALVQNPSDKEDGVPPQRPYVVRHDWPTGNFLLMTNEPKPDHALILYVNDYIGHHRFIYSVNRFPALISVVVSTWILFGNHSPTSEQRRLAITAFFTGLWTFIGELYGLHNHNNWHPTALIQTVFRVFHLCVDIPLSIAMIALSAVALKSTPSNENSAVLLAMGLMILCLSATSITLGIFAWRNLRADEKTYKERHGKFLNGELLNNVKQRPQSF